MNCRVVLGIVATMFSGLAIGQEPLITPFTQQDPNYQHAMESMARAQQLLAQAQREVEKSESAFRMPGFNYQQLASDLQIVQDGIRPMLVPEQRRLEYKTLIPSGGYVTVDELPSNRHME